MIFFSTTFSPGSGVAGLKELRYLFARFYFFCMIPGVQDDMEGCPDEDLNVLYMVLSALIGTFLFAVYEITFFIVKASRTKKNIHKKNQLKDEEFRDLQVELYGEGVLLKDSLSNTNHSTTSNSRKQAKAAPHKPVSVVPDKHDEKPSFVSEELMA
jgi:hypothetical protein